MSTPARAAMRRNAIGGTLPETQRIDCPKCYSAAVCAALHFALLLHNLFRKPIVKQRSGYRGDAKPRSAWAKSLFACGTRNPTAGQDESEKNGELCSNSYRMKRLGTGHMRHGLSLRLGRINAHDYRTRT